MKDSHRRYVAEPVPTSEAALEFIEKFPARFMMEDGFETPEEASKYWRRRIERASEPLYFVRDTMYKRVVCLDLKHGAEQRAVLYEALASALGQA